MGRLESVFVFYGCTGGGERLRGREEPPLVLLGERGLGRGYSFSFGGDSTLQVCAGREYHGLFSRSSTAAPPRRDPVLAAECRHALYRLCEHFPAEVLAW